MSKPSLFERLLSICGKRYDDPDVIALHAEEGLGPPPPTSTDFHTPVRVSNKPKGYQVFYMGALRRPEFWPPRPVPGGFPNYVQLVELRPAFQQYLPEPFVVEMDETRAKELAISTSKGRVTSHTVYRLLDRGDRSLRVVVGPLGPRMSLAIDELADDDPRLQPLSYEEKTELQNQADKLAAPPAQSTRAFPRRPGVPEAEPLPPVLHEVRAAFEAWYRQKPRRIPRDHDYIDFQMHSQRDVTFITGWTQNPGHEAEFYVFGKDGQGSGVAFWLVSDAPLAEQPVVYLGSEGEGSVRPVSKNLPDFLELLSVGLGPYEAPDPREAGVPLEPLLGVRAVLNAHFPSHVSRSPDAIVKEAAQKFGDIEARMMELSFKP